MVMRRNLHPTPGEELLESLGIDKDGDTGETKPFGWKHMPDPGQFTWFDEDGQLRNMQELQDELAQLGIDLGEADQIIEDAREELRQAREDIEDGKERLAAAEEDIEQAKEDIEDGAVRIGEAEQEIEQAKQDISDGADRIGQTEQELEDTKEDLAGGLVRLGTAEQTLATTETNLSALDTRLTTDVGAAMTEAQNARNRADAAHGIASQATQDATNAFNNAVEAMERAKATSLLPDGDFPDRTSKHWSLGTSGMVTNWYANPWNTGDTALQAVRDGLCSIRWATVPVEGGRIYRIVGKYVMGRVRIAGQWTTADGDGSFTAWTPYQTGGTTANPGYVTVDVEAPRGATNMRVEFQHDGSANTYWFSCHAYDVTEALAAQTRADQAAAAAQGADKKADAAMELAQKKNLTPWGNFETENDTRYTVTNLWTRSNMHDIPYGGSTLGAGRSGTYALRGLPRVQASITGDPVPVTPGRTYRVSFDLWSLSATTTAMGMVLMWKRQDGSTYNGSLTWGNNRLTNYPGKKNFEWTTITEDYLVDFVCDDGFPPAAMIPRFYVWGTESTGWTNVDNITVYDVTEARTAQELAEAADEKATVALASAGGGAKNYAGTLVPSFTKDPDTNQPVAKGSGYFRWNNTTERHTIGQYYYDGSIWVSTLIAGSVMAWLDLNKLTVVGSAQIMQLDVVEAITASMGHYNLLTAEKMVIASSENIVPNGDLSVRDEDGNPPGWDTNFHNAQGDTVSFSGSTLCYINNTFEVKEGEKYEVSITAMRSSGNTSGVYLQAVIDGNRQSGSTHAMFANDRTVGGDAVHTTTTVEWTSPWSDRISLALWANYAASSGWLHVKEIRIRRKTGGSLLVDGSVDARVVNAQSVAGAVGNFIEMNVGQLTATGTTVLNDVVAQRIAAYSGKYIELKVEQLTATGTSTLNNVVAQRIAAEVGTFVKVNVENLIATGTSTLNNVVAQRIAAGVGTFVKVNVENLLATGTSTLNNVVAQRIAAGVGNFIELNVEQLVATETATINELVAKRIAAATAVFQNVYVDRLLATDVAIDTAVIRQLAAELVSSGRFIAGTPGGARVELTSSGLTGYSSEGTQNVRLGTGEERIWLGERMNNRGKKGVGLGLINGSYGLLWNGANSAPGLAASILGEDDGYIRIHSAAKSKNNTGQQFTLTVNPFGIWGGEVGNPRFEIVENMIRLNGFEFPTAPAASTQWGSFPPGFHLIQQSMANLPVNTHGVMWVHRLTHGAKTFLFLSDNGSGAFYTTRSSGGTYSGWKKMTP